jgi:membrane peptidoglycan carboxypeptidase
MVNRRRRRGWLTPRGRVVLIGGLAFVATAGIAVPTLKGALQRFDPSIVASDPFDPADPRERVAPPSPSSPSPTVDTAVRTPDPSDAPPASDLPDVSEISEIADVSDVSNVSDVQEPPAVSAAPIGVTAPNPPTAASAVDRPYFDPPRSRERFELARNQPGMIDPRAARRLAEWRDPGEGDVLVATPGRVRVEYSMDEALTERVFEIMRRGRVAQGHAIVIDPRSGKLLAYVSTDERTLPAAKAYPAASIVKILTASAVLETRGVGDAATCVYRGNKYRLNRRRLEPPKDGREASLETALASSNNQCFARWALHSVGEPRLRETFERFGWLSRPAPGHEAGRLEELQTDLDLGRLGSGLDGVLVTPLHVAQIASILTHGEWVEPWWIDRVVDAFGRPLRVAERRPNRPVLERDVAARLRSMMVATTKRGTAKSAFRDRRGRPRVGSIDVAGKTGNLTGWDPYGRYEWFLGLAPAENPTVAVVVLQLQGHMWWRRSTELASDVLRAVFCDRAGCRTELAKRLTEEDAERAMPTLISQTSRPRVVPQSE